MSPSQLLPVFEALRDAAMASKGNRPAINALCSVAAKLIAARRTVDEAAQVMRIAETCDFTPEFYPGGVRVHWSTYDQMSDNREPHLQTM